MVKKTLFIAIALLTLAGLDSHAASRADKLFQEAMMKDSGERDPEAAIKLYQEVIDRAGDDQRLIAKARLNMGGCLERLGKPKEAETLYKQIVQTPAASKEVSQAAQTNLERLQTQEKKAQADAARAKPMVLVREFHDTGFSISGGPAMLMSGGHIGGDLSIAGRYKLSRKERPLALYAELGGLYPFAGDDISDSVKTWNLTTTDSASLKLRYQMHLALVAELPHGKQRHTIPEVGIGAALTSSKISYTSANSVGDSSESNWSPYLRAGVRLRADKTLSVVLETSYTANPYSQNIQISDPAHKQTFDFPNSLWNVAAKVQVKIGSTKTVMRPKE